MVSRPAASDLTLTFVINFQKNFLSELYQIQIMWLFLPKLSLHEKNLAFKGQEGQERSCNFLFQDFWELRLMQIRFLWKMNHFLFIQKLNLVEFKGVYFTVAWPSWPLKAKIFSSKDFFSKKLYMVEIMLFFVYWLLRYRRGPKSKRDRVQVWFNKVALRPACTVLFGGTKNRFLCSKNQFFYPQDTPSIVVRKTCFPNNTVKHRLAHTL